MFFINKGFLSNAFELGECVTKMSYRREID